MADAVEYRFLSGYHIKPDLFAGFCRRQVVSNCRRKVDGKWIVKSDPFVDDWDADDYRELLQNLKTIISEGGMAVGAFVDDVLKGFAAVSAVPIGQNKEYLDLVYIHVSEDKRGQGIGRGLFGIAGEWAKAQGAKKLYISAQSSVETQAFYYVMGCVEAVEYNAEHVREEPFDCQLELEL